MFLGKFNKNYTVNYINHFTCITNYDIITKNNRNNRMVVNMSKIKENIVKLLSCLIPSKELRKKFRQDMLAGPINNKYLNKQIELINYKLDLIMNHFLEIQNAKQATGNLRFYQEKRTSFLKTAVELFEANNIEYWVDFGTLIGAVRHKGFIPWDNDIDVSIYQKDWEKAISLLRDYYKNDEKYELIDITVLNPKATKNCMYKIVRKKHMWNMIDFYCYIDAPENSNAVAAAPARITSPRMDKSLIFPTIYADFENIKVKIPNNYDRYITKIYGDWNLFPTSINYSAEQDRYRIPLDIEME